MKPPRAASSPRLSAAATPDGGCVMSNYSPSFTNVAYGSDPAQIMDIELPAGDGEELDRQLRPAVALVSAWMADLARKQRVDTTLLATRADLVSLLRGDADARLLQGWRAELVGDGIQRLVQGKAGLTFDGRGGLRLIDVAATPSEIPA